MRIAFVGCGAAGRPLGAAWRRSGHTIGAVLCRSTAGEAVAAMGGGTPEGSLDDADAVVFATPDTALARAARDHPLRPDQTALHLSGHLPSTVLEPTGARTASLHPLRAFADLQTALAALPGTFFFVEGEGVDVAERLARDAGGVPARIRTDAKTLYHTGAAVASNALVALVAFARSLLERAGVSPDLALEALLSLARGALDNLAAVGIPNGLTGPVARGDVEVVRGHFDALAPHERALYRELVLATIPVARAKGGLTAEGEEQLRRIVEGARS